MARKLKVIPMRGIPFSNEFNIASYDIISPQSWELNTATNVLQEQGVLGNVITKTLPIKERSYSINWIGPKKEINKIINYLTKTSAKYFLFGNLVDQNVLTPGIMFDSRSMVASVADNRKGPVDLYRDRLRYFHGEGYNPGSTGIWVQSGYYTHGIESFAYLPKDTSYTLQLLPVSDSSNVYTDKHLENITFAAQAYHVDANLSAVSYNINLNRRSETFTLDSVPHDRVLHLTLVPPSVSGSGAVNYVPLIISKRGTSIVLDDYEDLPSLVRPVDDFVYNIISPNVAELSMNFKEITHVTE